MIADEVDRYEASAGQGKDRGGGEGDPLELAEQRTETYWNRKIAHVSTPLISGSSRIEASYEESDKRVYECRCPHCDEFFVVEFEHIEWDKDDGKTGRERHRTETAHVICVGCGTAWSETDRQKAIRTGRWRPTATVYGDCRVSDQRLCLQAGEPGEDRAALDPGQGQPRAREDLHQPGLRQDVAGEWRGAGP